MKNTKTPTNTPAPTVSEPMTVTVADIARAAGVDPKTLRGRMRAKLQCRADSHTKRYDRMVVDSPEYRRVIACLPTLK